MIPLSTLLRFSLIDKHEQTAKVEDFSIKLEDNIYPKITNLLWKNSQRGIYKVCWESVHAIDFQRKQINIENFESGEAASEDWSERAVLLKHDILDSLIMNLTNHSVVLANDIWLEEQDGQLRLKAIDTSFKAILRRLTGGRFSKSIKEDLCDWKYVEFLRGDPQYALRGLDYHGLTDHLPYGDIAFMADQLPYLYGAELISLLPDQIATDTLEVMYTTLQVQVFEELEENCAKRILTLMRPDIATDLLSHLDTARTQYWLDHIPRLQANRIIELLRFPEDSAGGIMTNDMITFSKDTSVEDAIFALRDLIRNPDYINFIEMLYIVEDTASQQLVGGMSLRDLLMAENHHRLEDVMNTYQITIQPLEKARNAAERVLQSELAALPVTNPHGRLIGMVTADKALDLIAPTSGNRESLILFS